MIPAAPDELFDILLGLIRAVAGGKVIVIGRIALIVRDTVFLTQSHVEEFNVVLANRRRDGILFPKVLGKAQHNGGMKMVQGDKVCVARLAAAVEQFFLCVDG